LTNYSNKLLIGNKEIESMDVNMIKTDFIGWYLSCQSDLKSQVESNNKLEDINKIESQHISKYKYTDLCNFRYPYQFACRGSTCFHHSDNDNDNGNSWSWCFNKFFNKHQIASQLGLTFDELILSLSEQKAKFVLTPKWDGSCIQIMSNDNQLHVYTLGSVNNDLVMEDHYKFRDTVLDLLPSAVVDYLHGHPNTTLIAEVCSPHNKIITSYDYRVNSQGSLHYLAIIDSDGLPSITVPNELSSSSCNIMSFHPHRYQYHDDTDIQAAMNDMLLQHPEVYGDNPEGLVLYAIFSDYVTNDDVKGVKGVKKDVSIPIAKIKRQEYLDVIRSGTKGKQATATIGSSRDFKELQMKVIQATIDDYPLVEVQRLHVDKFKSWLRSTQEQMDSVWQQVLQCTTKKEVAKTSAHVWFTHYMFTCYDKKTEPNIIAYLLLSSHNKDKKSNSNTILTNYQDKGGDLWFVNI
jgi:hypothetical protein